MSDKRWFFGRDHIGNYMRRFILATPWFSIRLHSILRSDVERDLHDHPWSFVSVLLRGGYTEKRPKTVAPCFAEDLSGIETTETTHRSTWYNRWGWRLATDRHRISFVYPDTWSLFIYGPVRQWWGFYTKAGKIYFQDYVAQHSTRRISEGDIVSITHQERLP